MREYQNGLCGNVQMCVSLQRPNLDVLINGKHIMRVTKNVYYLLHIELAHLLNLYFSFLPESPTNE